MSLFKGNFLKFDEKNTIHELIINIDKEYIYEYSGVFRPAKATYHNAFHADH